MFLNAVTWTKFVLHTEVLKYIFPTHLLRGHTNFALVYLKNENYLYTIFKRHSRSSTIRIFFSFILYAYTGCQKRIQMFSFCFSLNAWKSSQDTLSMCVTKLNIFVCKEHIFIIEDIYILTQKLQLKRFMIMHGHTHFLFTRLLYSTPNTCWSFFVCQMTFCAYNFIDR